MAGDDDPKLEKLVPDPRKSESGTDTAAETNVDMQIMYDLSPVTGAAGQGAFARTPMVRVEYHF